jgi:hypothetical protein
MLSLLAISLVCISCVGHYYEYYPTTYNNFSIMKEYQYANNGYGLAINFFRNIETGQLRSMVISTNGMFVLKSDLFGDSIEDNFFVVDPEAAEFKIDGEKIQLNRKRHAFPDLGLYYSIDSHRIIINLENKTPSPVNLDKTIFMIPSDFIQKDGERVIKDTIFLKQYEKTNFKRTITMKKKNGYPPYYGLDN